MTPCLFYWAKFYNSAIPSVTNLFIQFAEDAAELVTALAPHMGGAVVAATVEGGRVGQRRLGR